MDMFSALLEDFHTRAPELELREYEPMERHTSFRVGGPVRLMALPRSEAQAAIALHDLCVVLAKEIARLSPVSCRGSPRSTPG